MKKIKQILCLILTIISFARVSYADEFSLRHCSLLPVVDNFGNALAFKVYEKVEDYLKENKWCSYKSNSDLLNVFSRYRHNLENHLKETAVVNTFAKKLEVGTIIRITMKSESDKVLLSLDIVGENGEDLYLSESIMMDKTDPELYFQTIKGWLEIYEAGLPYDGRVLGVLGEQLTFSVEKRMVVKSGQKIKIKRFLSKKKHPLLKKVVAWESKLVGRAEIISLSQGQGFARIKLLLDEKMIKKGDWVQLEDYDKTLEYVPVKSDGSSNNDAQQIARLGRVRLGVGMTNVGLSSTGASGSSSYGDYIFGFHVDGEAWITRTYFAQAEFVKASGAVKKKSGNPVNSKVDYNISTMKIGGGYKYLPLGFFYGPQVNFYGGYGKYGYTTDSSAVDGLGSVSISGIYLGVSGSMPIQKGLRFFGRGEMMPFPEFTDEDNIYGGKKSLSSLLLEFGGEYQLRPNFWMNLSYGFVNNIATLKGTNSKSAHKNSTFLLSTFIGI